MEPGIRLEHVLLIMRIKLQVRPTITRIFASEAKCVLTFFLDDAITLRSSKGPCHVAKGAFSCGYQVDTPTEFTVRLFSLFLFLCVHWSRMLITKLNRSRISSWPMRAVQHSMPTRYPRFNIKARFTSRLNIRLSWSSPGITYDLESILLCLFISRGYFGPDMVFAS